MKDNPMTNEGYSNDYNEGYEEGFADGASYNENLIDDHVQPLLTELWDFIDESASSQAKKLDKYKRLHRDVKSFLRKFTQK